MNYARDIESLTAVLGARVERPFPLSFGTIVPRARFEFSHDFDDLGAQGVDYADFTGASVFFLPSSGWQRDQYRLSIGSRLLLPAGWTLEADFGLQGSATGHLGELRFRIGKNF